MRRQFEHVFGDFLVLDALEILVGLAHLVGVTQRHAHHALAAGLQRDDVLARSENNFADRHHSLGADGFADYGECLLSDFTVGHDVIGVRQIEIVDLPLGHELIDFDGALALERDGLKLLRLQGDVIALADLVALDDVRGLHVLAGFSVDLAVADAIAGVAIELVKTDLLAPGRRGEQRDGARNKRELEIPLPISTRGHWSTPSIVVLDSKGAQNIELRQIRRLIPYWITPKAVYPSAFFARTNRKRRHLAKNKLIVGRSRYTREQLCLNVFAIPALGTGMQRHVHGRGLGLAHHVQRGAVAALLPRDFLFARSQRRADVVRG